MTTLDTSRARCPRCQQLKDVADFLPDHASVPQTTPQARCLYCRQGLNRFRRKRAAELGVCVVASCPEPVHEKLRCLEHFTQNRAQVDAYRAKRDGKRLAAKLAAGLPLAVEVREASK